MNDQQQAAQYSDIPGVAAPVNTFEYVKLQYFLLARETAKIEAQLQYGDTCPPDKFKAFYTVLSELFKLTKSFIREEIAQRVNTFLYPSKWRGQPQRDALVDGVNVANAFLEELEQCGLNQVFEEPIEPAFMLEDPEIT